MKIDDRLKTFIHENLSLIDENTKESWEEIYDKLSRQWLPVGKFTELLLSINIDPAEIMRYIPENYLILSNIVYYKIADNIQAIGQESFRYCENLSSLVIPGNVKSIGRCAFSNCKNLKEVYIKSGVQKIHEHAFSSCPVTIYVEDEEKPKNWSKNWISSAQKVVWGYKNI